MHNLKLMNIMHLSCVKLVLVSKKRMLHLQLSQVSETFRDLVDEPDKRFQRFFDYYCNVKLNSSFGIERYVRSGREMLRMANIYFKEQDAFHAFVIYSRYAVLFGEKLRQHPAYKQLERADLAELNRNVREIALPRAEQLVCVLHAFLFSHCP